MDVLQLAILSATSFLVGFSGALMPGAVFVTVVLQVARKGWISGPLIVVGHGILEAALTLALALGLSTLIGMESVHAAIGVFGGFILILMGVDLLRNATHATLQRHQIERPPRIARLSPVLSGLLASSVNPYFYLWWATVGNMFTLEGLRIAGMAGVGVFFLSHWMSDLSWYTLVSITLSRGRRYMTDRIYRTILGSCGLLVLMLGAWFLWGGIRGIL
ncbi:MAG: LysE family transporter [archaeon]